jgi:site-specific recombinase XerC
MRTNFTNAIAHEDPSPHTADMCGATCANRCAQDFGRCAHEEISRRAIEGLSLSTLRAMRDAVRTFGEYVAATNQLLSAEALGGWIAAMRGRGLAPGTLLVRYRYLRVVCQGLLQHGTLDEDSFAGLRPPRSRAPLVSFPNDREIAALFDPRSYHDEHCARDLAILSTLAATGLRRAEMSGMRLRDAKGEALDFEEGWVRVMGKGRKERIIPLPPHCLRRIKTYFNGPRRGSRFAENEYLWLGHRGPLSPSSINRILTERTRMLGISHLHPRQLRHAWANRLLGSTFNEGDVMVLGGWSSRSMLSRYGAYAVSERAMRRARTEVERLEPWGSGSAGDEEKRRGMQTASSTGRKAS